VRSTTHRRGNTLKPLAMSDRLTICNLQRPRRAPQSFGPA
jgi:homoaconitase/3-isopropylmalate dehydratase large subunit